MVSRIEQIDENTWQAPDVYGHAPVFHKYKNDHGFMGRDRREDILNPPPKQIRWDSSKLVENRDGQEHVTEDDLVHDGFAFFGAAQGDFYVDMRIDSVSNRGKFIWPAVFALIIWGFVRIVSSFGEDSSAWGWFDYPFWIGGGLCFAWDLFRRAQLPVRFHAKNQEVYVYYRRVLYRIPWDQCDISVQVAMYHTGMGNMRDGYDLVLWLDPKFAVNNKKKSGRPRRLVLNHMDEYHHNPYLYWEYVRRFMAGKAMYDYKNTRPKIMFFKKQILPMLVGICFYPILIFYKTSDVALQIDYINPFKRRWPKAVDEWTGEKCNWH